MKKTRLFKSLLLAAGLTMGASAWAQTSTLMEYGTGDVAWSAENLAEWTAGGTPTISDDGDYVEISGKNGSYETSKTIAPTANAIINVQAVWRGRSNTGRAFSAGNGSYFRFGNIIVAQNDQDKKHGYGFTGLDNISSVTTFTAGSYRVDITSCTWLLIDMEINTANNTLTSFTIKSENGATTYASQENITLSDADYTTVAFGYRKAGSVSYANAEDLKSVKITETIQSVETADYTVKYVCDGAEVKDAATRTGVVGDNIALNASDTEDFYANDKKYIYVSSDVDGKTVAEGAVITITFREAETWGYTVNFIYGETILGTKTGTVFEGDQVSVPYPKYLANEGKLFSKGSGLSTANEYNYKFTPAADAEVKTVEYAAVEGVTNVIFCSEAEEIDGLTPITTGNAAARSSNSAAGYASEDSRIVTLPAGTYQMKVALYDGTSAHNSSWSFYANSTSNEALFTIDCTGINYTEYDAQTFTLTEDANIIVKKNGGNNVGIDALYITGENDPIDPIYAIAGDFFSTSAGAFDVDKEMTKSGENEYTLTIDGFEATAATTYYYKFHQMGAWTGYQLPAEGNADYYFENAGKYDLVFTANTSAHTLSLVATTHHDYTVAGSSSDIFSSAWDATYTANDMTKQSDGTYAITYSDVTFGEETEVQFKVVEDHGWDVSYPEQNVSMTYPAGTYDITITFNPSDHSVAYSPVIASFVVAGTENFFGTDWNGTDENNKMTMNSDGTYSITYAKVLTEGFHAEYKVVKDNTVWYPTDNQAIDIKMDGSYELTITIDPTTNSVSSAMTIAKSITNAGYATYCSPYDLNFEGTGITAYIAKAEGTKVTFEEVTSAPAGTGLLLKGDEGSYKLAMEASSTDVSGNVLIGKLAAEEVPAGSFVLMDGTEGVGFYNTVNPFTVSANTAYIAAATGGARSFIGFSGETTAIEGVASAEQQSSVVYDLQGRRVMNAKKGLYIVNGKKVILK